MRRIVRHIRVLWRTESLLAELRIANATKQIALQLCAGLIAAFALAMLNYAALLALQPLWGAAVAALMVALVDLLVAAGLFVYASSLKPGPEAAMLREVRDLALQDLEAEVANIETEFQTARETVKSLVQHPIGAIAPSVIAPLLKAVINGLRAPKTKS